MSNDIPSPAADIVDAAKVDDLSHHPLPVRNLIPLIPQHFLATLLTHHARAYQPHTITITSITPKAISLSYLQPVEELAFKALNRSCTIPFTPPLPPIPKSAPTNETKCIEWENLCADRLKEMEKEAKTILEGRSDIVVERYLPPNLMGSYLAMVQFIFLTFFIIIWLVYGETIPFGIGTFLSTKLFDREWRFTATVIFHAAILVKRWGDVIDMAKKLRKYNVDRRGRFTTGPWLYWLVTAFFEGWRCLARFDEEVARVGRSMAEKEKGGESKKKK